MPLSCVVNDVEEESHELNKFWEPELYCFAQPCELYRLRSLVTQGTVLVLPEILGVLG